MGPPPALPSLRRTVVLRHLADRAASAVVVQVLAEADVEPPEGGSFRLVDSETEEARDLYVDAARVVGAPDRTILLRHILPNVVAPVIVVGTLGVGAAILVAATLSFLGLGSQPPTAEWGRMLSEGRQYLREQWWIATFPGLAIMLTVLALNMLGDGLRDALDPRLRV